MSYQEFNELPEGWVYASYKDGASLPAAPKWSSEKQPPAIGAVVKVTMNGLGAGVVKGYFVEDGWLGVLVKLSNPPGWWLKQNAAAIAKGQRLSHIFGAELAA